MTGDAEDDFSNVEETGRGFGSLANRDLVGWRQARRAAAHVQLRRALERYVRDPLDPPSSESFAMLSEALGDVLDYAWPESRTAVDGFAIDFIERDGTHLTLIGTVVLLDDTARVHFRPVTADLEPRSASTIRIASPHYEHVSWKDLARNPGQIPFWEHQIRV